MIKTWWYKGVNGRDGDKELVGSGLPESNGVPLCKPVEPSAGVDTGNWVIHGRC